MMRRMTRCIILTMAVALLSPALVAHVPRHLAGTQCQVFFFEEFENPVN